MDDTTLERIITAGIKIGTISTLKSLGLMSEIIMPSQAYRMYSKKLVKEWRNKGWIVCYPTGNKQRGSFTLNDQN